jgi:hypothetical protein
MTRSDFFLAWAHRKEYVDQLDVWEVDCALSWLSAIAEEMMSAGGLSVEDTRCLYNALECATRSTRAIRAHLHLRNFEHHETSLQMLFLAIEAIIGFGFDWGSHLDDDFPPSVLEEYEKAMKEYQTFDCPELPRPLPILALKKIVRNISSLTRTLPVGPFSSQPPIDVKMYNFDDSLPPLGMIVRFVFLPVAIVSIARFFRRWLENRSFFDLESGIDPVAEKIVEEISIPLNKLIEDNGWEFSPWFNKVVHSHPWINPNAS